MLKKPGIRKLFKIFKFNSHFHVTTTAYIDCLEKPLKSTLQDFSLRKQ